MRSDVYPAAGCLKFFKMWSFAFVILSASVARGVSSQPTSETPLENLCPCPTASNNQDIKSPSSGIGSSSAPNFLPWTSNVAVNQLHSMVMHGMPCVCSLSQSKTPIRDDYNYSPGIGSHKLHTRAQTWNDARKICNDEGAHLAVINSIAEAQVLGEIFNRSGPVKGAAYADLAYLGIHDLYKEGDWVTVLGDSLPRTGYTKWADKWGGQPDNGGGRQNCGVLLREGGLDDVACEVAFAFFCELPAMQLFH